DGPTLPRALQHGQSDLDFLAALAARAGLGLHLRQDTLHLHDLSEPIGPEITLSWGTTLRSATIDQNPTAGPRPIRLQGQILGALGDADGSLEQEDADGDGEALLRPGATVLGPSDAESMVQAERRRQEASAWVLRGTAAGDPRLRPGAGVRLSPPVAAPDLARSFVLTEVVHAFDDRAGFVSTISSSPIAAPTCIAPEASAMVSLATVTSVADPEGAGRVLATLDAYDQVETAWLPVLSPAAGSDSGLIVQPDVGARVLVLSSGLDPGAGVVVGVMFTGTLPDDSVDDGRSRRQFWRTSGGLRVGLDDVAQAITVADAAGSKVRLAPGLVTVESVGDLHLSAPGKAIVITAASVDFVEG
ncbi:MAG: Rhs element Vgr protein, partial [Pseudonocardiales bacterium]|nr:Rhs element Vgr protein [Pseudonocardiales bacterium]